MLRNFAVAYSQSVKNADYSALISYCTEVVLDGNLLQSSSSSMSSLDLGTSLGCNIVYINSHSRKVITLIYGILKDDRPQAVLNENRDLLHPGVYFIVDIHDFHAFLNAFKALPLTRQEADSVTLNYQLDYFLLEHFRRYAHDGLLPKLTQYVMEHDMDRNIAMNSVLDWMLNAGISIFRKEQFIEYVRTCHGMYLPSMPHEPEAFDLNRIADRDGRLEAELKKLDLSPIVERYRVAVGNWSCMDLANEDIRKHVVETYRATLPSVQIHSIFEHETAPFSNFHYLFESIFNATLLTYRERGLLYQSLIRIMNA